MPSARRALLACLLLLAPGVAMPEQNRTLDVSLMLSSGEQRAVFREIARDMEARHPGLRVNVHAFADATYKQHLRTWLRNERFDVMYWHAGERLHELVRDNLVASLGSAQASSSWQDAFPETILKTVRFGGHFYGVPYSYYPWGFFYHRALFRDLDLRVPRNWQDFLSVAEQLQDAGVTPFALGSREYWPLGGWFDYLNLRLNGPDYHRQLLDGTIPLTDDGVETVLRTWKELIDRGYFIKGHQELSWKSVLPLLYRRKAGMVLIGSFAGYEIPKRQRPEIGFFGFPRMDPSVPRVEEAPTDLFFLPHHARDNDMARRFLARLRSADTQEKINNATGMLSPHREARTAERLFIDESRAVVEDSRELTQFLDRDAPEHFATPLLQELRRFMRSPDVEATQRRLEGIRQSAFPEAAMESNPRTGVQ